MTQEAMERLIEMGIRLSSEKDYNRLLESILADAMSLTRCDAGTLYLKEGDCLSFKIIRNNTRKKYLGGDGEKVDMPPVPLNQDHLCSAALLNDKVICIENVRNCKSLEFSGLIRCDEQPGYDIQSILVVPMKNRDGEKIGVLQLINAMDQEGNVTSFTVDEVHMVESMASQAAVAVQNMLYVEAIKELFHSFVQVLSKAVDERTPYNATHTRNMVKYGRRFIDYLNEAAEKEGREAEFSAEHKEEFLMSVWLHDIGKLVTPLEIMNKSAKLRPEELERIQHRFQIMRLQCRVSFLENRMGQDEMNGELERIGKAEELVKHVNEAGFLADETQDEICRIGERTYVDVDGAIKKWLTDSEIKELSIRKGTLSEKEREVMENHVVITAKLLAEIQFSKDYEFVPAWAAGHHEFLDGTGYPNHLKGEEIPREVRILTILDIFDALTADDRPYKPGMPVGEALSILQDMADQEGKLDSDLTKQFIDSCCWTV